MADYPANMVFRMRLFPEPKGEPRPTILALDWNHNVDSTECQYKRIIAIGTISRTRIFAQLTDEVVRNKCWEMMFNMHHSGPTRSIAIQWKPLDWKVLAVGTDDGLALTVQIIHWEGESFKKCNRIEVPTKHQLESVCWDSAGQYVLATLGPIEGMKTNKMIVIKYPTRADCIKSIVDVGYKGSYSAVFPPLGNFIISCSADVRTLWVWTEKESNDWIRVSKIRHGGISKMSFNREGSLLAGIGSSLKIWDCEVENLEVGQPKLKLTHRQTELEDDKRRRRGVTLEEHCANLSSVFFCSNNMILTGSSEGSMCLHGIPKSNKKLKTFKVQAFQFCDVQFMYPKGEIACVQESSDSRSHLLASGGTDGIVTIWELVEGQHRPQITRNPSLEIYRYEPDYKRLDDSKNLEKDDADSVLSISTDKNDDLELLLTVKAELGELKKKQNHIQKTVKEADDGMRTGLEVMKKVANDLHSAKVQSDEVNTELERIAQLLAFGL